MSEAKLGFVDYRETMAVPLLSPGRHHGAAAFGNTDSTVHDDMSRLSPGVISRNSSYRGVGGSSHSMHSAGEASSMDRQRSASRVSDLSLLAFGNIKSITAVLTFIYTLSYLHSTCSYHLQPVNAHS